MGSLCNILSIDFSECIILQATLAGEHPYFRSCRVLHKDHWKPKVLWLCKVKNWRFWEHEIIEGLCTHVIRQREKKSIKMFGGMLHWGSHVALENSLNWWWQVEYFKTYPIPDHDVMHHSENLFQFCLVPLKPSGLVRSSVRLQTESVKLLVPHKPLSSFILSIAYWEQKKTYTSISHTHL